jgi:hypothetical protein
VCLTSLFAYYSESEPRARELMEQMLILVFCYDNWQRYLAFKAQRGQDSSIFDEGALSYITKPILPVPLTSDSETVIQHLMERAFHLDITHEGPLNPILPRPFHLVSVGLTEECLTRHKISSDEHILKVSRATTLSLFHRCLSSPSSEPGPLELFFQKHRAKLVFAGTYQKRAVAAYNPQGLMPTEIRIIGLDPFKETSHLGSLQASASIFQRTQVLKPIGKEGYEINPGSKVQLKLGFGDVATVVTTKGAQKKLQELRTRGDFEKLVDAIQLNNRTTHMGPGDLHIEFHDGDVIVTLFKDSVLEPIKKLLKWTRLEWDVCQNFQTFKSLMILLSDQLGRLYAETWSKLVAKTGYVVVGPKTFELNVGLRPVEEFKISIVDLVNDKCYPIHEAMEILADSFHFYVFDTLLYSEDAYVRAFANLFRLLQDFLGYHTSGRAGDGLNLVHLFAKWMRAYINCGKPKYGTTSLEELQAIFKMTPWQFEAYLLNRFVRMRPDGPCLFKDEFVEMLMAWSKQFGKGQDFENLQEDIVILLIVRLCADFGTPKYSTEPAKPADREAISRLLKELKVATNERRESFDGKEVAAAAEKVDNEMDWNTYKEEESSRKRKCNSKSVEHNDENKEISRENQQQAVDAIRQMLLAGRVAEDEEEEDGGQCEAGDKGSNKRPAKNKQDETHKYADRDIFAVGKKEFVSFLKTRKQEQERFEKRVACIDECVEYAQYSKERTQEARASQASEQPKRQPLGKRLYKVLYPDSEHQYT